MLKLVISYARDDRTFVESLSRTLTRLHHQVDVDSELRGGQQWWDVILSWIEQCDAMIVIVSTAALKSEACRRERAYAAALGKPILPVAIEAYTQALPRELASRQIVRYTDHSEDAVIELAAGLAELPPALALPSVMPPRPEAPLSYLIDLVERASAPNLNQVEQRAVADGLERALRSGDPEERSGGAVVVAQMKARQDLFKDVYDRLQTVEQLNGHRPDAGPPPRDAVQTPITAIPPTRSPDRVVPLPPPPPEERISPPGPASHGGWASVQQGLAPVPPEGQLGPAVASQRKGRSKVVTALAIIGVIFVVIIILGMLGSGSQTCGYDQFGQWVCY